jgi:uncharacterized membrane protein YkoI
MNKQLSLRLRVLATGALIIPAFIGTAVALEGGKYLSQTKLSLIEARQIALKAYPGKIVSEEIEQEAGGSGLRFSFVVDNTKAKHEVGVDAKNGKLLENSVEHPD